MRDDLGTFYQDEQFVSLFPRRGQPAYSPWRLALVSVMQYVENLSDRQAANAVRARVEGTISQGVRSFRLRQARYIGLEKTHLQQLLTACCNQYCQGG